MYEEALFKMAKDHYLVNRKLCISLTALVVMHHILETQCTLWEITEKHAHYINNKTKKVLFINICHHVNITAI